ncbi:MAG: hypothetical protein HYS06_05460 [Methylocystis sp.]|nr:hypothetical protein [Methylocystis sp.]
MQLTPQDIIDAIALLDLATKAGGLGAAQKALPLALKLQAIGNEIAAQEQAARQAEETA